MPEELISTPALEKEIYDDVEAGTEMYFRTPSGEVTISRIGPAEQDYPEQRKREREKWVALDEYGTFKIQPYHMDRPFEVLFQRGGAKELSERQIVDNGFNFRPPLVPRCHATVGQPGHFAPKGVTKHTPRCWQGAATAEFPQLEGKTIPGPFPCKRCYDDTGEEKVFPRERGLRQHESVVHADAIGTDRMAEQLIQGLGAVRPATSDLDLRGENLKLQEQIEALTEAQPAANVPVSGHPFVCGYDMQGFPSRYQFDKHMAEHKKEAVAA